MAAGVERVDRRLADEEAEDLADRVSGQVQPVPVGGWDCGPAAWQMPPGGWIFCFISVATLPPRYVMISNTTFQKGGVQKPGTTARSEQMSRMVRPTGGGAPGARGPPRLA